MLARLEDKSLIDFLTVYFKIILFCRTVIHYLVSLVRHYGDIVYIRLTYIDEVNLPRTIRP